MKSDIVRAIQTYLDRESCQYSIMINGAWGIGKTHFIKNELMPAFAQCEFIYLSLYGINSLQKLEDLIQAQLALRTNSEIREQNITAFQRVAPTQADQDRVLVQGNFDAQRADQDRLQLVFCLDDLERWSGDLDACLSYVNRLVEQENYKCILVGNIDEISESGMRAYANAREKTIRHVYQFDNDYSAIFDIALKLPGYSSKVSERFLHSMVKNNKVVLQRLLDRISIKNIRTISEAFQLYEYVFQRHSKLFRGNRNLAFAYLMALLSALILVNRFLVDKEHRNKLMNQDHREGKGFRYLSEIGYFDDSASGFLTDDARYLLDTIFYRMDQISLKGLFSIVRNGYYKKSDFVGDFDSWRKQQQYETYLDKEKFYQLDDAEALRVFTEMYSSLIDKKAVKNPITILLLSERIIEDIAAGVAELNPVQFKAKIIDTVDHLYESGRMESVEVSIFDLSGDRFVNCRAIYNHVQKRSRLYQRVAEELQVARFWQDIAEKTQNPQSLLARYKAASVFVFGQADVILNSLESLDNDRMYRLTDWVENNLDDSYSPETLQQLPLVEIRRLLKMIWRKYENKVGIKAAQFRRLSRNLRSRFVSEDFEAE